MFNKRLLKKSQIIIFKKPDILSVDNNLFCEKIDQQFFQRKFYKKLFKFPYEEITLNIKDMGSIFDYIKQTCTVYNDLILRPLYKANNIAQITNNNKFIKPKSFLTKDVPNCPQYNFIYGIKGSGEIYVEWRDILNRKGCEIYKIKEGDIFGFSADIKYSLRSDNKLYTVLYKYQIIHES